MHTLPVLFMALGPSVIEKIADLKRYIAISKAFEDAEVTSLRKAHAYCQEHCSRLGLDDEAIASRQSFLDSAKQVEHLLQRHFGPGTQLFLRLGRGMPWHGFTEKGKEAVPLVAECVDWYATAR